MQSTATRSALVSAYPLLRLSGAPEAQLELLPGGEGLRRADTGERFELRGGVLDLLDPGFRATDAQKILDRGWSAGIYDWARPRLPRLLGMPAFADEVTEVVERLALGTGDQVLDIACGQGNFTAEFARVVGPEGLVVGVDISRAMLARAAQRMGREGFENVLLVRADALHLPIGDASFRRVNCSGGLHQFPDLTAAIAEMGRVSTPAARISVSGFAESERDSRRRFKRWAAVRWEAHFVPMDRLTRELEGAGFEGVHSDMSGRWVGYAWAAKPVQRSDR